MLLRRRATRVVAGLLVASLFAVAAAAAGFDHGPYCGAPSRDSVVISWSSTPSLPVRVEYATRSDFEATGAMASSASVPPSEETLTTATSHVTLEDLEPATNYVYRVVLESEEGETSSSVGAFSTEPEAGEAVSFVVLSDTQQQLEGTNRLALVGDAIADDPMKIDFILHAGDVVEIPSSFYWDDWFASFARMLLRAPFIPVLGNHEKNHRSYYENFVLPPGQGSHDERWWALHWGDVVVVGLDTNVRKPADYVAQQAWATEHLSGPEPHKFVIFHHPVFSSDAYHDTGTFLDKIFHPIFVEHGVDIVFNGHSHHYEHIVRDGVTYLVVGGGGAAPRETKPEYVQGSDVSVEGHFFYVRVFAGPDGIQVETVSVAEQRPDGTCVPSAGELLDAFALPREARPAEPRRSLVWIALAAILTASVVWLVVRASRD